MKARTTFSVAVDEPALVLYWPMADGGLWNEEASAMVERLEDMFEVFVTCVGSGRGALALHDVSAAARFMGCSSVVVISPEDCSPLGADLEALSEDLGTPVVAIESEWSTIAVAEAYREARRYAQRAA